MNCILTCFHTTLHILEKEIMNGCMRCLFHHTHVFVKLEATEWKIHFFVAQNHQSLQNTNYPFYDINNNWAFGASPPCIQCLTPFKLACISLVRNIAHMLTYFGGQGKVITGWHSLIQVDIENLDQTLCVMDYETMKFPDALVVVIDGHMTASQHDHINNNTTVSRSKWCWLLIGLYDSMFSINHTKNHFEFHLLKFQYMLLLIELNLIKTMNSNIEFSFLIQTWIKMQDASQLSTSSSMLFLKLTKENLAVKLQQWVQIMYTPIKITIFLKYFLYSFLLAMVAIMLKDGILLEHINPLSLMIRLHIQTVSHQKFFILMIFVSLVTMHNKNIVSSTEHIFT